MRVLPHCAQRLPFEEVRQQVLADGAATHGDPIALVGAQLYAYALWTTFRREEPLGWGQLIDDALDNVHGWAELDPEAVPAGWSSHLPDDYGERWTRVVEETAGRLQYARNEIAHGALAIEDRVLRDLGCFSPTGGAGTVSATAAIYLASRYASDPVQGLLRAAFARGADTDTLAAMTGAILGAVSGARVQS